MIVVLLQLLAWTAFIGALVLWPAGTLAYPGAWAFIALFGLGGGAITFWLARYSPRLLRERLASPIQRDQKPWDRVFLLLLILGFLSWMALMGWDAARSGFTAVPVWLQMLGGLSLVLYGLGVWLTFRENTFAAPVVKIQEGQRAIDSGPYAIVRHPMYASCLLMFIGLPLLLGSWLGLAFAPLFILGIAWRAVQEEQVLRRELNGYADYVGRVRYRFIPGVW
jgi:protein-S-isoprenylcysteine O-methyltransferase Ste14